MGAELLHRQIETKYRNADQISSKRTCSCCFWAVAGLGSPSVGSTPTGHLALPQSLGGVATPGSGECHAPCESNIEHGPKWQTVWLHH